MENWKAVFCYLFLGQKICMFAVTRPSLLKSTNPKLFFPENLQKIIEDFLKNFNVSLGATTSCIYLLKSQRFASSVPFNVIEMV